MGGSGIGWIRTREAEPSRYAFLIPIAKTYAATSVKTTDPVRGRGRSPV